MNPSHPLPTSAPAAAAAGTARAGVVQLTIKERAALHAAYMPLFAEGGIFIPTTRSHRLGDEVYMLMSLPDEVQRYPIVGKVAWITPPGAGGNRTQGVGIRFPADEKSRALKLRIEQILGAHLGSDRPTQTV